MSTSTKIAPTDWAAQARYTRRLGRHYARLMRLYFASLSIWCDNPVAERARTRLGTVQAAYRAAQTAWGAYHANRLTNAWLSGIDSAQ